MSGLIEASVDRDEILKELREICCVSSTNGSIVFGRFGFADVIERGGHGIVCKVQCDQVEYAVKICRHAADQRFQREIGITRKLNELGFSIPRLVEHGKMPRGHDFYVMTLLRDSTLRQRLIHERRLPLPTIASIGVELCAALDALHSVGIVHRDLKPGNVFLSKYSGHAIIIDYSLSGCSEAFAVADITKIEAEKVRAGNRPLRLMGTPGYASPEQVKYGLGSTSKWSDLYSVGAILHECWTGLSLQPQGAFADVADFIRKKRSSAADSTADPALTNATCDSLGRELGAVIKELLTIDLDLRQKRFDDGALSALRKLSTIRESYVQRPEPRRVPKTVTAVAVPEPHTCIRSFGIAADGKSLTVVARPQTAEEYHRLFGSFCKGNLRAYGAPFGFEERSTEMRRAALSILVQRVESLERLRYLFLDREANDNAEKLFEEFGCEYPGKIDMFRSKYKGLLVSAANVRNSEGATLAQATYLVGSTEAGTRAILYVPTQAKDGPHALVVADGVSDLASLLESHFEAAWEAIH